MWHKTVCVTTVNLECCSESGGGVIMNRGGIKGNRQDKRK